MEAKGKVLQALNRDTVSLTLKQILSFFVMHSTPLNKVEETSHR